MTKEQFFDKCNSAGIVGSTFDFCTKCLWIPSENWFVRIMYDTSGCQLVPEDEEDGINDYIDYKINTFTDINDVLFEDGDGGIWMFNNEENCDVQEQTWNMLENEIFYKKEIPDVIWLDINLEKM